MKALRSIFTFLLIMGLFIGLLLYAVRFKPRKWLRQNQEVAEPFARALLSGESPSLPPSLTNCYIHTSSTHVSFTVGGGPWVSYGLAYSIHGKIPHHGFVGLRKWKPIEDHWFFFVAE
jgi:hypothetical protein